MISVNPIWRTARLAVALVSLTGLSRASAAEGRLINLSTRAQTGLSADILTAGFVLSGAGSQNVLVRAIGPTLGNFGLSGVLADPILTLVDASGAVVASNDNWLPSQAEAMSSVGAFPLASGSKDAALLLTLNAGAYTAQVTSADGKSTGLALVEVYEVAASGATLRNLSTRANVGAGAKLAIPGLVISPGSGNRRLLIRAAGPALEAFGLSSTLADPILSVVDASGSTTLASNDNWSAPTGPAPTSAVTVGNAFSAAGAFGFASGSKDAAVLTELAPGNYTIQVSGVGQTSGLALIEVYDVTGVSISTTALPPAIVTQPQPVVVANGSSATLAVTASGSAPLAYQWAKAGVLIGGASNATYTLASVGVADAGDYSVTISNAAGAVTSAAATLTVTGGSANASTTAVTAAAQAFYATLTGPQQTSVQLPWSLATARRWSNLPASMSARNGVAWGALSTAQRAAATTLISTALGNTGTTLLTDMQAADDYLAASGGGAAYGNGNYYIAFVGTPSTTSFWVLQITGHHLTYNLSYNGTYRTPTPLFLAVEPKAAFTIAGKSYDPMVVQRTAVADLLPALAAYSGATLAGTYTDILFGATGSGGIDGTYPKAYPTAATGRGVAFSTLAAADQEKVRNAIRSYVNTQSAELASELLALYLSDAALAQTFVGYAGSTNVTTSNTYCRIDGPRLWIEFSVQRGVIFGSDVHYHTIWRDKAGDFGGNF